MTKGIAHDRALDRSNLAVVFAEALFASAAQPSAPLSNREVRTAIAGELSRRGFAGCTAEVAYEFGAHPLEAAGRMQWALRTVADFRNGRRVWPLAANSNDSSVRAGGYGRRSIGGYA